MNDDVCDDCHLHFDRMYCHPNPIGHRVKS